MDAYEAWARLGLERLRLERALRNAARHAGPAAPAQRDGTGELSGMDEHVADVATETFEREVDFGLLQTFEADLAAFDEAMRRLAAGTYGRCVACGAVIDDERLRAVPATAYCLRHQEAAEVAAGARRDAVQHGGTDLEAAAHLDLLPAEERPSTTSAEEAAVHVARR